MNHDSFFIQLEKHQHWLANRAAGMAPVPPKPAFREFDLRAVSLAEHEFDLSEALFENCRFNACDFSSLPLLNAEFRTSEFLACLFVKCDLRGANARGSDFAGSDFTSADLTDADFSNCNLSSCKFDWSWLIRSDLRGSKMRDISLANARMLRTKLFGDEAFIVKSLDGVTAKELDFSPSGDGSLILEGSALDRVFRGS